MEKETVNPGRLTAVVRSKAFELGFEVVAVAPVGPSPDFDLFMRWIEDGHAAEMSYLPGRAAERADPRHLLPEARSIVVLGANYFSGNLPSELRNDRSRGLIASYAWSADYHDTLKRRLFDLDTALREASGRTDMGRACVDTSPILERSWASRAGLGFGGKNTCLIVPGAGSWFFLAELLVPEKLAYGSWTASEPVPVSHSHEGTCGQCTRCLNICPTGAFPEPFILDSRRCISYLTIENREAIPLELRPLLANWVFGCDLCQTICPWNRRYATRRQLPRTGELAEVAAPKLLDLLALDEKGFRQRFRKSPIKRAKRRGLLRNVCVALGNWADPAAIPGLSQAMEDSESLIRSHAAWALGKIGTAHARLLLQSCLEKEHDPEVLLEITAALAMK
ncbi:MAG: tRNA epoxyqueuosine(34) reductase QueG [Chloroflexota bacterium]|nr:tRNA epoxyqueuosine(34) reductase QueG [Chloroflexota bacterium]